ncbi:hypothetical protein D9602_01795 [Sphingomonas sp. TX0522]|nr:hypothetical protein [Sphingomonas sp. TX0522]
MTSAIRVRAAAGTVRRAGFRFGPKAVMLTSEQITPPQLHALATEPRLVVDMLVDGVFVAMSPEVLSAIGVLADMTGGMSPVEVLDAMPDLARHPDLERAIALAAGAQAAAVPGAGTGADHPATHPGAILPQLEPDPNPALPAAGGTSDAGVEIAAPPPPPPPADVPDHKPARHGKPAKPQAD